MQMRLPSLRDRANHVLSVIARDYRMVPFSHRRVVFGLMSIGVRHHGVSGRRIRAFANLRKGLGMKGLVATACASVLILGVLSQPPVYALTPQQELMKTCNEQAGKQKLAGDARKNFMSDCLSGKTSSGLTRQQELMKSCNVQANSQKLKGDARKQFMSTCLKG